jgi:hypothetical protein
MPLGITIYSLYTFISEPYQHHVYASPTIQNFHLNINSNRSLPTLSLLFSYFKNDQRRRSTVDATLSLSLIFASWRNATVFCCPIWMEDLVRPDAKSCKYFFCPPSPSLHSLQNDPQSVRQLSPPHPYNPTQQ